MADLKPFFDIVRAKFGNLSQSQVDGFNTVVDLSVGLPLEHRAYIIATAWHETAHTMQPIAEYGKGKGKLYGQPTGPYHQAYYGRGYVQLTWLKNYEKAAMATGAELVAHPDLALEPDIAGKILIEGMTGGWFTGVKLEMCHDYVSMRRVVNGTDCNSLIAGYAMAFELALKALPTPNPAAAESDLAPAADPSKIPEPAPTVQPAPHGGFLDWLRRTFNPVTAPAADPAPAQGLDFLETLSSTHGDTKVSALKTELDGAVASVKAALAAKDATISDLTAKLAATAGLADAEDTAAMKQAVADLNALAPAPAAEASPAPANQ
jgi:hypothetical protein